MSYDCHWVQLLGYIVEICMLLYPPALTTFTAVSKMLQNSSHSRVENITRRYTSPVERVALTGLPLLPSLCLAKNKQTNKQK